MASSSSKLVGIVGAGLLAAGAACSSAGTSGGGAAAAAGYGGGGTSGTGGGINLGGSGGSGNGGSSGGYSCIPGVPEPRAVDVPGNGQDDDCNGAVDDMPTNCDSAITAVEDNDPMNAARAIGLCQVSDGNSWGVVEAKYVMADGSTLGTTIGHGLVDDWGPAVNVQEGKRMLVISSGTARRPTDLGFQSPAGAQHDLGGLPEESPMPPGFPYDPPACPGVSGAGNANDPVALELKIKAPINAKSLKFNFDFYTYEYPQFICSPYNDFFVVLQSPPPTNAVKGNISFDKQNNPVSVNNGFLEVCVAQTAGGKNFACALGSGQLAGTGYDEIDWQGPHAATGWLETQSPVEPGSTFTLRFAVWDVGDHILDSAVLIDNFQFSADPSTGSVTNPVPVPK